MNKLYLNFMISMQHNQANFLSNLNIFDYKL